MTNSGVQDVYPLTHAQAGLLVECLTEPAPGLYVVQMRFELSGDLDTGRLCSAWQSVVARHAALRTALAWDELPRPVQVVARSVELPFSETDLRHVPAEGRVARLAEDLRADRSRPFDLTRPPLMRVAVYRMGDHSWEMIWTHHHVVLDGWSSVTVIDDLWAHYARVEPPALSSRYHDFVSGLAMWRDVHEAADVEFWKAAAASGCPPTLLRTDHSRRCATVPWSELFLELDTGRIAAWLRGARRLKVSLSTLVHGAWAMALTADGKHHEQVGFDVVCSSRDLVPAAHDAVGMCVASVPLSVDVNPQRPCSAWLSGIARDRAAAESHCAVGPDERRRAAGDLGVPRNRGYALAVEGYEQGSLGGSKTIGELTVRYRGVHEATSFAIAGGLPVGKPPQLKVSFDLRRIAPADAQRLLGRWAQAADLLVSDAARSVGDVLAAVTPVAPRLTSTGDTLTSVWASQVRAGPDRVAVVAADHSWTYSELDAAAEAIASDVRALGLEPEARVGICIDRSALLVAAILGVLKAGAAYVPLDPRYPLEHRRMIIHDADISVVITAGESPPADMAGVRTLSAARATAAASIDPSNRRAVPWEGSGISSRSLCYVLYTSGTSGRPKGVLMEHGNVARLIRAGQERLGLRANDVWTMFHSTAFDFSVWEMWGALALGACLVVVTADQLTSPPELLDLIERQRVTVLDQNAHRLPPAARLRHRTRKAARRPAPACRSRRRRHLQGRFARLVQPAG